MLLLLSWGALLIFVSWGASLFCQIFTHNFSRLNFQTGSQADRKRRALKDQIELTLSIENHNRTPLGEVLYQINKEGAKYRKTAAKRQLGTNKDLRANDRVDSLFLDCGDGIGCEN